MDEAKSKKAKKERKTSGHYCMAFILVAFTISLVAGAILRGRKPRRLCNFDSAYRRYTCKIRDETEIPGEISDTALAIHIGNTEEKHENKFGTLSHANFSRFTHLHDLRLVKCGITALDKDVFISHNRLRHLDLRHNLITTLEAESFSGISLLESLQLAHNPLMTLDAGVFSGVTVDNLLFDHNPTLYTISVDTFVDSVVQTFRCNHCSLSAISLDTFKPVAEHIQNISIINNLAGLQLEPDTFDGLELNILDLTNSKLEGLLFLESLRAENVILNNNPLKAFEPSNSSIKNSDIRHLSLFACNMTEMPSGFLEYFSSLEYMNASKNQFTELDLSVLTRTPALKTLDISGNKIQAIYGNSTDIKLKSLFLHDNDLQILPSDLEILFDSIDNISIHGNPLHCNCELIWLWQWLKKFENAEKLNGIRSISCATPTPANLTQVPSETLECKAPVILNVSLDTSTHELVCQAYGDPTPEITWYNPAGLSISSKQELRRRRQPDVYFQIAVTIPGNYTCAASNILGNDSFSVDSSGILNLKHAPSKPKTIKIIETPEGFTITCILLVLLGYLLRTT